MPLLQICRYIRVKIRYLRSTTCLNSLPPSTAISRRRCCSPAASRRHRHAPSDRLPTGRFWQWDPGIFKSVNDVICGVVFLGIRLYMQAMKQDLINAKSTALVLLNTRNIRSYKSISEMIEPDDDDSTWGNRFAFLHVPLPKMETDPLSFVVKANKLIRRKKNSGAIILTGKVLESLRKWRGPEVTAKYIHSTLKNTSMTVSNIMGPVEKMALSNQPVKGLYFMVAGVPQNLTITMVSYMGVLRLALGTENGLIDSPKLKSCIQNAFDIILKAALSSAI